MTLGPILDQSRVVVSVGPGGVGKTSTSAAIGFEAARRGMRVCVLTIDPARRLANALGLSAFGGEERLVDPEAFVARGLEPPKGQMSAMMLDIKEAWDAVVTQHHPDPKRRKRLMSNRLYHALSTSLAGSQEYMAMEKLHQLAERTEDRLDLIVVDTPPANHALDFLEAPNRMLQALDNDATRWLLEPYQEGKKQSRGLAGRVFDRGSSFVIKQLSRFTGTAILEDLAELLSGFQGMFEGFRERAQAVQARLSADDTSFVVLSAPRGGGVAAANRFAEILDGAGVHPRAFVFNRATPALALSEAPEGLEDEVRKAGGSVGQTDRLRRLAELVARERAEEEARVAELAERWSYPRLMIPEFPRDVHDLHSLNALRAHLFETDGTNVPASVSS